MITAIVLIVLKVFIWRGKAAYVIYIKIVTFTMHFVDVNDAKITI
jgi:hypothetical protein